MNFAAIDPKFFSWLINAWLSRRLVFNNGIAAQQQMQPELHPM